MVLEDPAWINEANEVLESDRYRSSYQEAWQHILEAGQLGVVAVLTSRSPAVDPLKTDAPFALLGMVSEQERLELLRRVEEYPDGDRATRRPSVR